LKWPLDRKRVEPGIDATITRKDRELGFAGIINSERVTTFLKKIGEKDFPGDIDFNITASKDGECVFSLTKNPLTRERHSFILEGNVENFNLDDINAQLANKKNTIEAITVSFLHRLKGSGSSTLDKLSDIFAEEVKRVGEAQVINPEKERWYRRLLRPFVSAD
jgi:hypothetical protein